MISYEWNGDDLKEKEREIEIRKWICELIVCLKKSVWNCELISIELIEWYRSEWNEYENENELMIITTIQNINLR